MIRRFRFLVLCCRPWSPSKGNNDEDSVKNSQYIVEDYKSRIVSLARKTLAKETNSWGMEIVRTELEEIGPPKVMPLTPDGHDRA